MVIMKQLTAGQITEMAMNELTARGFEVWRQNQAHIKGRKFRGKLGASDITGYHRYTGIRLECECKTIGDVLSDDQKAFLISISEANAHALVAFDNGNGGIHIGTIYDYYRLRIK